MEKENDFQTVESVMSELYRETYLNSYRIIVTGSCKFTDYDLMSRELDKLFWLSPEFCDNDIKIISGMADGVDTLAIRYADEHKLTKILFPANWNSYHRIAGILRNEDMLSVATHLVVFEDDESNDTPHMIEIAKAKGIPIWVLKYPTTVAKQQIGLERWN